MISLKLIRKKEIEEEKSESKRYAFTMWRLMVRRVRAHVAASVKIPSGILIYIGLLCRLCAIRGWGNPLLEYSPMDTWRVSNSVSFINRSRKRRKASKFCLPTLGTSALLIRQRGGGWWVAPSFFWCNMPLRSFPKFHEISFHLRVSRRMVNLPPRFRGGVHALDTLDVGLERVEKMEGGVFHRVLSRAKVLALSRHRVLRGDGT